MRQIKFMKRGQRVVSLFLGFLGLVLFVLGWAAPRLTAQQPNGPSDVPQIPPGQAYRLTTLLSDIPGLAPVLDPLLVNPWGISMSSSSPFWVANNGTSTSQLIRGDVGGTPVVLNGSPQTITISGSLPTGTVANSTPDFILPGACASAPCVARFLFASETGNITGWNPNAPAAGSTTAVNAASNPGHVYKGLAIGASSGFNYLYAADFANKKIDVYDKTFAVVSLAGTFTDPTLPADYSPFNIQNLGGTLYIAYAKIDSSTGDEVAGPGNGYVSKFNTDGTFSSRLISNGPLNAPWGLAIAPSGPSNPFGFFSGALLVGNFGEGSPSINAFNPTTGAFLGSLQNEGGEAIEIDE